MFVLNFDGLVVYFGRFVWLRVCDFDSSLVGGCFVCWVALLFC